MDAAACEVRLWDADAVMVADAATVGSNFSVISGGIQLCQT
jgi:hypothetical protein